MIEKSYRCQHCGRGFKRKSWFDKHDCKDRKEFDQKHEIDVVGGHRLFVYWQTKTGLMKNGKEKTLEDFKKSPLFNSFMKLCEFISRNGILVPYQYVDWLIRNDVKERDWKQWETLTRFQEDMRQQEDPSFQSGNTLIAIRSWADRHGVPMKSFFSEVTPGELVLMVKNNQMSPWVLFGYETALVELVDRLAQEHMYQINEYINISRWMGMIRANTENTTIIKQIMDVGLNEQV